MASPKPQTCEMDDGQLRSLTELLLDEGSAVLLPTEALHTQHSANKTTRYRRSVGRPTENLRSARGRRFSADLQGLSGASRTRTGDLLGAIQRIVPISPDLEAVDLQGCFAIACSAGFGWIPPDIGGLPLDSGTRGDECLNVSVGRACRGCAASAACMASGTPAARHD
jgi:hypothetical protein